MPIVSVKGWRTDVRPGGPPLSLVELLKTEAGMDSVEAKESIDRLMKGRPIDAFFDLGEDRAAKLFVSKLRGFGLEAEVEDEKRKWWLGSPTRPWFLKYMLGYLAMFCLWFPIFLSQPHTILAKILSIAMGIYTLSLLFAAGRGEPSELDKRLPTIIRLGLPLLLLLIFGIIQQPLIGMVLLALALGGALCFLIIRSLNRTQ
ncbi:MAG: hypothetical protein PHX83_02100 [Acidobacteriia bacterium]|nr:hypothetical protein [Terriglobia bacterium]